MSHFGSARPPRGARPPLTALLVAIVLALTPALGACSGGDDEPAPQSSSKSPAPEESTPAVRTKVAAGRTSGRLPVAVRQRTVHQVGAVVDRWFDAAYVGGDHPRTDVADAFPGFTRGAATQARRDRALMSNAKLDADVESVTATRRRVWVDTLGVRRHAVAATARFLLDLRVEGKGSRTVEVRGRLRLTRSPHGWQVFAYDVTRGTTSGKAHGTQRQDDKSGHDKNGHDKNHQGGHR